MDEKLKEMREAAKELAGLASYAEIVGGVSVNRPGIRKWCDRVFALDREIEDMEWSTEETETKQA